MRLLVTYAGNSKPEPDAKREVLDMLLQSVPVNASFQFRLDRIFAVSYCCDAILYNYFHQTAVFSSNEDIPQYTADLCSFTVLCCPTVRGAGEVCVCVFCFFCVLFSSAVLFDRRTETFVCV